MAECWRNLTATGALPMAATDNLNFGNPEKPEIMSQLVHAIKGIGEACTALDFPIVSGNVSLYNETNGVAIMPTPTIGGVGLIPDWKRMGRIGFADENQAIFLVGAPADWGTHLGQSVYLRDIHGRSDGPPPPVDLELERKVGDFVRELIRDGMATAVHDCSSGGLALAIAEMAMASGVGATINALNGPDPIPVFFGEDQGRYVVTVERDDIDELLEMAEEKGIFAPFIGTTGEAVVTLGNARPVTIEQLQKAHESWFPDFMAGELPASE